MTLALNKYTFFHKSSLFYSILFSIFLMVQIYLGTYFVFEHCNELHKKSNKKLYTKKNGRKITVICFLFSFFFRIHVESGEEITIFFSFFLFTLDFSFVKNQRKLTGSLLFLFAQSEQ